MGWKVPGGYAPKAVRLLRNTLEFARDPVPEENISKGCNLDYQGGKMAA
jgi:hypothetical protein